MQPEPHPRTASDERIDPTPQCDGGRYAPPIEAASSDPEVLRAALLREAIEHRRAECRATMQAEVVKLALDLLVREPDVEGFFGGLTKMMVEESEGYTCAVWLLDDRGEACNLWMAYVEDRLVTSPKGVESSRDGVDASQRGFPCESMAAHLFSYTPGWTETVEYVLSDDARLPDDVHAFAQRSGCAALVATPLLLGTRTLGWMTVGSRGPTEPESQWWRVVLIEAVARQAALALHHSRVVEHSRLEERRKGVLEERNRIARDIHDNLAQGFAAILMQLQAARRDRSMPPAVATSIDVAVDLARTHLTEARRSVGALRPNVGSGEDIGAALKRVTELNQRTTTVPIDLVVDELPRYGDGVEREIVAIVQEALTNAVRHSRARRIVVRASSVQSVGLRLSVADDGRGITRDGSASGFGMTSMQERAERIGASLTIVTAPRNGTEVVVAWNPASLPTQVHAIS